MGCHGGHGALHQNRPRELDHRRRRPEVQIDVEPLGDDTKRINDRRHEESRLDGDIPHLIQIAVSKEQNARRKRKPDDDRDERDAVGQEQEQRLAPRRASGRRKKESNDDGEDAQRDDRVRN